MIVRLTVWSASYQLSFTPFIIGNVAVRIGKKSGISDCCRTFIIANIYPRSNFAFQVGEDLHLYRVHILVNVFFYSQVVGHTRRYA